jgi:hypothetical protein
MSAPLSIENGSGLEYEATVEYLRKIAQRGPVSYETILEHFYMSQENTQGCLLATIHLLPIMANIIFSHLFPQYFQKHDDITHQAGKIAAHLKRIITTDGNLEHYLQGNQSAEKKNPLYWHFQASADEYAINCRMVNGNEVEVFFYKNANPKENFSLILSKVDWYAGTAAVHIEILEHKRLVTLYDVDCAEVLPLLMQSIAYCAIQNLGKTVDPNWTSQFYWLSSSNSNSLKPGSSSIKPD